MMQLKKLHSASLIIILLTALVILGKIFVDTDPFPSQEYKIYDWMSRLRKRPTASPVVILAIDDKSIRSIGSWPWPRSYIAGMIERLSSAMASIASPATFPLLTFLSAGVVNFFVPSGGGQWALQSDVLLTSARGTHGACLAESTMAMILAFTRGIRQCLDPAVVFEAGTIEGHGVDTRRLRLLGGGADLGRPHRPGR